MFFVFLLTNVSICYIIILSKNFFIYIWRF